jgi:hypothetical protein
MSEIDTYYLDPLFHDDRIGESSFGVAPIKGRKYEWRLTPRYGEVQIGYKLDHSQWTEDMSLKDAAPELVEFLEKMARTVRIIHEVRNLPRSGVTFDIEDGWQMPEDRRGDGHR